jgi:uncharacterized protein
MKRLMAIALISAAAAFSYECLPYRAEVSNGVIEAAKCGDAEHIEKFLARGGRIRHVSDENGRTPLMWAAWNRHRNVVQLLLKHGARVNQEDDRDENDHGTTALAFAVDGRDLKTIEDLIEAGADINCQSGQTNHTPLMAAVSFRRPDIVKSLIRHGADIGLRDKKHQTALDWAQSPKDPEIVEILGSVLRLRCRIWSKTENCT